jgi:hypothetical protein
MWSLWWALQYKLQLMTRSTNGQRITAISSETDH